MTSGFIYDDGQPTSDDETKAIFEEIHSQITREGGRHIYSHKVQSVAMAYCIVVVV